ncbi:MAG: hypothetical protein OJI67_02920, partial [Prosthecobacter sp.]|nr:hypothetical protein [Prosthecobacter sp.]
VRGLNQIHALPKDLRMSGSARCALFQAIFEGAFNRLPVSISESVMEQFEEVPFLRPFMDLTPDLNGVARILRDLSILEKIFDQLDVGSLEQRLRTGVESAVLEPVELPEIKEESGLTSQAPLDLITSLENASGELAQVAGLVRRLTAILHVPKPMARDEELPLGGVSDITNRGDPSRLLITELAWDDMTFAVRLAQGEALYMRRESPPSEPPPKRVILLDTGIFMWGKPRLFALGVALALQRQNEENVRVLTLQGNSFVPVSLSTVDEIRDQLARLEPLPNPGDALAAFALTEDYELIPSDEEVFLITHPTALEAASSQYIWKSLASDLPLYTVEVDREGAIGLSRHSRAGVRLLSQAKIDLNSLFGEKTQAVSSLTISSAELPHFYHRSPWPLYQPVVPKNGQVFRLGDKGYVGLSETGCLCHWQPQSMCGRVLYPDAPSDTLGSIAFDPENERRVIFIFDGMDNQTLHVLTCSLDGAEPSAVQKVKGRMHLLKGCLIQSGALVLHFLESSLALSLQDGRVLDSVNRYSANASHDGAWFDGEKLHLSGVSSMGQLSKTVQSMPRKWHKRHRINYITNVGFSTLGNLVIQKERGRMYVLNHKEKGGIEWVMTPSVNVTLQPLVSMDLPDWPNSRLSQAKFKDGRSVVLDPRGFLHVLELGKQGHEVSIVLVKGSTSAWKQTGFFYGEPSLLWGEPIGAAHSLKSVCKHLFRPCSS